MAKAQFTTEDIAQAVAQFTAGTEARLVPAVGKNSPVTVYGENPNPYKPVLPKLQEEENVEIQEFDN